MRLDALREAWEARWEEALACWSRYTRLFAPHWCTTEDEELAEDLTQSFAMIRLDDHAVVISLRQVVERHLEGFPVEVMAHEIGHHVYCPGDLTDHGRMLARMRAALPTLERLAGLVANLYADLLINDRLQRHEACDMAGLYGALPKSEGKLWNLYMRIYEILWSLERGTLCRGDHDAATEGDAVLGSRVIRAYAKRWVDGSGRFAALCLPYLLEDGGTGIAELMEGWGDLAGGAAGGDPGGLAEIEHGEFDGAIHPASDPDLAGAAARGDGSEPGPLFPDLRGGKKTVKRYRGPVEYGELLDALGLGLTPEQATQRYYRERAVPHLIRFPVREAPRATEPLPEGLDVWDPGSPLEKADWLESVIRSPVVVPGVTTVQRTYGSGTGHDPDTLPLDLYVGIDCSGSMPNPRHDVSFPVLAAVIMSLSALRAGARVMAVLSGEPGRSVGTPGFVATEAPVLELLTGYLGSGYAFGIHRLAEVFDDRGEHERPVHVLIITDQDIFSMLANTEKGRLGRDVAVKALANARGGGSMVLHMPMSRFRGDEAQLLEDGWSVHHVSEWEELVAFAAQFSKQTWERTP